MNLAQQNLGLSSIGLVQPVVEDLIVCALVVAVLCHLLVEGLAHLLVLCLGSLASCLQLLIPALAASNTCLQVAMSCPHSVSKEQYANDVVQVQTHESKAQRGPACLLPAVLS